MRHGVADLPWLDEARLKYGPAVALLDLSSGGAQIETTSQRLQPGLTVVFEIMCRDRRLTIPSSVLRAHVSGLHPHLTYRAALAFKRRFDLPAVTSRRDETACGISLVHEHARLSLALRRLCDSEGRGNRDRAANLSGAATAAALAIMESATAVGRDDAFTSEVGRLLRALINAISSGATSATMVTLVTDSLRRVVPSWAITVTDGEPAMIQRGDAVSFDIPCPDGGLPARLLVELPRGHRLVQWHLQFLKVAAHLLTVVNEIGHLRRARVELVLPAGWKRLVVRYLDGRFLKGFCRDISPATGLIHLWMAPDAPPEARVTVPLKQVKAALFMHDQEDGPREQDADRRRRAGRRIDVTFVDGECLSGTTLAYSPGGQGFFVHPLDVRSHHSHTFVVAAAVRHVQFPKETDPAN